MTRGEISISRGKLIGQNGPGSLYVDTEGVSYLISAVDKWFNNYDEGTEEFDIHDIRLESFLNVKGFREAPIYRENTANKYEGRTKNSEIVIPLQRFPLTHYCDKCGTLTNLKPTYKNSNINCKKCNQARNHIQFPIVIACQNGHINDFPYFNFVHSKIGYNREMEHSVRVEKNGSSILNWTLKCSCGASKSLTGITGKSKEENEPSPFQKEMSGGACEGGKGWCGNDVKDSVCNESPQAILKNSINVYNPETISALSITNHTNEKNVDLQTIQNEEFDRLSLQVDSIRDDNLKVEKSFSGSENSIIKKVNYVRTLQEIVVQTGFHRLHASDDVESVNKALDSNVDSMIFSPDNGKINWYPAKKLFGEGIFIEFNSEVLEAWENHSEVKERFHKVSNRTSNFYLSEKFDSPSKIMLHTFSHALLRELANLAGYPLVALKEKLYFVEEKYGVLIYVTDSDKDGTFGGLVRLAKEEEFKRILERAINNIDWCSSDPVCSEIGVEYGQGINNSNGAACHNCSYVPSTTCSFRNCFLDREFLKKFNSSVSISEMRKWLPEKEVYRIQKGTLFSYNDWEEASGFESKTYYSDNAIPIPDFVDGKIIINDVGYDIKYLWEKEKQIVLYSDQELKSNEIIIDGWNIIKEV